MMGAMRAQNAARSRPKASHLKIATDRREFSFDWLSGKANVVFYAAIELGVVLICLPTVFRSYFVVNGTHSNLVLCIGAACARGLWRSSYHLGRQLHPRRPSW